MTNSQNHYTNGYEAGQAAGSWVLDGNSSVSTAQRLIDGYDAGDPEIMDLCPAPLSGEWAGESPVELLGDDYTDDDADQYELGFEQGFWDEVLTSARHMAGES